MYFIFFDFIFFLYIDQNQATTAKIMVRFVLSINSISIYAVSFDDYTLRYGAMGTNTCNQRFSLRHLTGYLFGSCLHSISRSLYSTISYAPFFICINTLRNDFFKITHWQNYFIITTYALFTLHHTNNIRVILQWYLLSAPHQF